MLIGAGDRAQLACLLEATARKPGNVHRWADFPETSYLDFVASSVVVGKELQLEKVCQFGVGPAIERAVRETRSQVGSNTNLGMILLLAPLVAVPAGGDLRAGLEAVLAGLSVADARAVYAAIRHATPGGLGDAPAQDVAAEPTVNLREAMTLAAGRDTVARQYANNFADVFDLGLPALELGLQRGWPLERAIVACHLTLMAGLPDTLIARKCGIDKAEESARRAAEVLKRGWPASVEGCAEIVSLDRWLRADGNRRNPGTTADLAAAVVYVALTLGLIPVPIHWSRSFDPADSALVGLCFSGSGTEQLIRAKAFS